MIEMNIPLDTIKLKINEQAGLSASEIDKRIKDKLDALSGLISKEGAAHIIANELGVKLVQTEGAVQIKSLLSGMRNVEFTGKVTRKFEIRQFDKGDRKGSVASLMVADDTGSIRLVFWNDQTEQFEKLSEGDVLRIQSGFVKDNQGRKEVHVNSASKITINPEGVKIKAAEYASPVKKKLSELKENDENIEVLGTVVQVFDPRFFEVCPKCQKRLTRKDDEFSCELHGTQMPDYSYVMNIFLDDGTSNIRTVFWKNQTQNLLKMQDEDITRLRQVPAEFEKIRKELLGQFVKIVGRVSRNEGFDSMELVANLVFPDPDPKQELKSLKQETSSEELRDAVGEKKADPDFDEVISIDDLEDV